MDDLPDLLIIISIAELFVEVFHVIEGQLVLGGHIKKSEVLVSSFFVEGISLSKKTLTILLVSSLQKPSKSRGAPPVESLMSMMSL